MNEIDRSPKYLPAEKGLEFTAMGEHMIYKATAADTGGAYSLAVEITPPGGGLPLHVHHAEDEAMFVLEGAYEVQCGDKRGSIFDKLSDHLWCQIVSGAGELYMFGTKTDADHAGGDPAQEWPALQ